MPVPKKRKIKVANFLICSMMYIGLLMLTQFILNLLGWNLGFFMGKHTTFAIWCSYVWFCTIVGRAIAKDNENPINFKVNLLLAVFGYVISLPVFFIGILISPVFTGY